MRREGVVHERDPPGSCLLGNPMSGADASHAPRVDLDVSQCGMVHHVDGLMSLMTPFASSQRHGVRLMRQRPIGREGRGNERFFQPGNADFPQGWQSSSSLLNGVIPDRARINQQTASGPSPSLAACT